MNKNQLSLQYLKGRGIEFGALHNPVSFDKKLASVDYADRLSREDAIYNFPELKSIADNIVETDIIVDLDQDDLSIIRKNNYDFVVANHVIEHVVNPIRFLKNISKNLKKGGYLYLTVPDKDFTHDKNRKLTRIRSLLKTYFLCKTKLDDERIIDYLENKLPVDNIHPETKKFFVKNNLPLSYYNGNSIPLDSKQREKLFQYHRDRSIHVHVWNRNSFNSFFHQINKYFNLRFNVKYYVEANLSIGEISFLLQKI